MTARLLEFTRFKGRDGDNAEMDFDPTLHELAKEVGMGRDAQQRSLCSSLSVGRAIGRTLAGSGGNLQELHPGIELRQSEFHQLLSQCDDAIPRCDQEDRHADRRGGGG